MERERLWHQIVSHGSELNTLTSQQQNVLRHLQNCRSEQAGLERYACEACGYETESRRSCHDRHCPCCQHRAIVRWCQARRRDVLPVQYFHLVFTLPHELNDWVSRHPSVLYRLLFECSWQTLSRFGWQRHRLQGQLGMLGVLHTWGQQLTRHVHLHCMVPGGVLTSTGQWRGVSKPYLFPVKALSRCYRGKMLSALTHAHQKGLLCHVSDAEFTHTMKRLSTQEWVVYSKPAVYGHERLIDYLGRYTRKIGLTLNRLSATVDGRIGLSYRDYRDGSSKQLTLSAIELLRRFCWHILPKGFMRIRYYGFLANAVRAKRLESIRLKLPVTTPSSPKSSDESTPTRVCPECGESHWRYVGIYWPLKLPSG